MDDPKLNETLNEYGERLHKAICELAEKTGISMEEAASRISAVLQTITESLKNAFEEIEKSFERLRESVAFRNDLSARRRKAERSRARRIEQEYHTAIKLHEHTIPFRRVYKPP